MKREILFSPVGELDNLFAVLKVTAARFVCALSFLYVLLPTSVTLLLASHVITWHFRNEWPRIKLQCLGYARPLSFLLPSTFNSDTLRPSIHPSIHQLSLCYIKIIYSSSTSILLSSLPSSQLSNKHMWLQWQEVNSVCWCVEWLVSWMVVQCRRYGWQSEVLNRPPPW